MEMREANDVTGEGFSSFLLLGMIHSGYAAFVTGSIEFVGKARAPPWIHREGEKALR
jgi:hypothetical protein